LFTNLGSDFSDAMRAIRRAPVFSSAIILTVAVTIAANTTIFSAVNAVLVRPLPYGEPDRIVQVAEKNDKLGLASFGSSVLNFLGWREQARSFEDLAALGANTYTLTGAGEPEQLPGSRISPALMRVLGLRPLAGRAFTAEEEKPGAPPVAMLGEALWKRRFGGDAGIIGRTITLNGVPATVVGIAPASINLLAGSEVYTPLTIDTAKEIRLNHVIVVFGRLKRGVRVEQAQAEMNTISARMDAQYPEIRDWGIRVTTLFDSFVSPQLERGLLVLAFAVGFVLLIACANIANLLLARSAPRSKEMAVRAAMGAGQSRLIAQLLTESLVLAVAGGAIGTAASIAAICVINNALPPNLLPVSGVQIDSTVLWFACGLTLLTGLLFGAAPALRLGKVDLNEVLKQTGRGFLGSARAMRNGLAAAEIALAAVLLIGAGLLIQSLAKLEAVRLGFQSRGLITFQVAPPDAKYPVIGKAPRFYRALLDSLGALPGVRNVAVSSGLPFGAGNYTTHPMLTTDPAIVPPGTKIPINWRIVSPGYFKTMSIPLLRGRDFTDSDGPDSPPVMIISQSTARRFWGDADPIGHTLRRSADPRIAFTVVGVVGDVRDTALNQESPALYYPVALRVANLMDVAVRTSGPPEAIVPAVRARIHALDPELAMANVKTMEDWISANAAQPRLNAILTGAFAAMALLIAAIGIYGVLAYSVNQRTREIGLRIALGARPGGVVQMIVREGMQVVSSGIVIGLLGGLALGRLLTSLLFGVAVYDPLTFGGAAILLSAIGLAACAMPARRAARVDPMVALRDE